MGIASRDLIIRHLRNAKIATVVSWLLIVFLILGIGAVAYGSEKERVDYVNFGVFLLKVVVISFIINSLSSYIIGILSFEEFQNFTRYTLEEASNRILKDINELKEHVKNEIRDVHEEEILEGRKYSAKYVVLDFIIKPTNPTDLTQPWEVVMIENRKGIRFSKKEPSYSSDTFVLDVWNGDLEKCSFPLGKVKCNGRSVVIDNIHKEKIANFLVGTMILQNPIPLQNKVIENIVIVRHFPADARAWPNIKENGEKYAKFGYTILFPVENAIYINIYVDSTEEGIEYFRRLLKKVEEDREKMIYVTEFEGRKTKRYAALPISSDPNNQTYSAILDKKDIQKLGIKENLEPIISFKVYPSMYGVIDAYKRFYIGYRVNIEIPHLHF